jgi:hypothetical protein
MHEIDGPSRYAMATYPLLLQALKGYSKSVELGNDLSCTVRAFGSTPPACFILQRTTFHVTR